jgi:hypothetical protein
MTVLKRESYNIVRQTFLKLLQQQFKKRQNLRSNKSYDSKKK